MWALYTRKTATTVQKMDCCCKLSIDNKRQTQKWKETKQKQPNKTTNQPENIWMERCRKVQALPIHGLTRVNRAWGR